MRVSFDMENVVVLFMRDQFSTRSNSLVSGQFSDIVLVQPMDFISKELRSALTVVLSLHLKFWVVSETGLAPRPPFFMARKSRWNLRIPSLAFVLIGNAARDVQYIMATVVVRMIIRVCQGHFLNGVRTRQVMPHGLVWLVTHHLLESSKVLDLQGQEPRMIRQSRDTQH